MAAADWDTMSRSVPSRLIVTADQIAPTGRSVNLHRTEQASLSSVASAPQRHRRLRLRRFMMLVTCGVALIAASPQPALAQTPITAAGSCTPSVVAAGSDGTVPITLSAGIPAGATVTDVELDISWSGVGEDIVAGLTGPSETFAGLVTGLDGTSAKLTFAEAATNRASELVKATDGAVAGAAAPLDTFAVFEGITPTSGAWSVIAFNLHEATELEVKSCELRLTLASPAGLTVAAAADPPTAGGGAGAAATPATLPVTGFGLRATLGVGVAALVTGVGLVWVARSRRRLVLGVVIAVGATALVAAEGPSPAAASVELMVTGPKVTVSPGFIPDDEAPWHWPNEVENPQRVWAEGLPPGSTVYLQQCEPNPMQGDYYHVPGIEVGDPIRCEEFGGHPNVDTLEWISEPVPFAVNGQGILDATVEHTWNGPITLVYHLGTEWPFDGEPIWEDNGNCIRATLPYCWLRIVDSAGRALAATLIPFACYSNPPLAGLTVNPASGVAPLEVTADASSSGVDGLCPAPIESYTFDFGDGTIVGPQASPVATHSFTEPDKEFVVTVTVRNTVGQYATSSAMVRTSAPDTDADGISDTHDNCRTVPNALQEDLDTDGKGDPCDPDIDGDGSSNDSDPCPIDAANACDSQPDGNDPEVDEDPDVVPCKAVAVDVIGDIGGLDWFGFNTGGTVCEPGAGRERLNLSRSGDVLLPAGTLAVMSAIFSVQYDDDAAANKIEYHDDDAGAEITGVFDLCAFPMPPGIGKVAGKGFLKLTAIMVKYGPARLVMKFTRMWLKAYEKLITSEWLRLGGLSDESVQAMTRAILGVDSALAAAFEKALEVASTAESLGNLNLCVPMWEVTVSMRAATDNRSVSYSVTDQGAPTPRVAVATNATPI